MWHDEWSGFNAMIQMEFAYCNVALVPVQGSIYLDEPSHDGSEYYPVANADDVVAKLKDAEYDPDIEGILIRIDSRGGALVASEIIMQAIQRSNLPTVALIREYGTSGVILWRQGRMLCLLLRFLMLVVLVLLCRILRM